MFIRLGTFGLSDPTGIFYFLFHLSNSSQRSFGRLVSAFSLRLDIFAVDWMLRLDGALNVLSRHCIGHLISTVHWTSRLDGALDVSDMVWMSSKGPKKSYKYDLANLLVPLIALSFDHQNHSKWPKWGHVRYGARYMLQINRCTDQLYALNVHQDLAG